MNVVVIGSSGFLGECVTRRLTSQGHVPISTHHTHPKFSGSLRYDFFSDEPDFLPDEPATVIFTSAVEISKTTEEVQAAMRRLLVHLKNHRFAYLSSDGIFDGAQGNYREEDVPYPKTQYGRNLLACETLIRQKLENYCIIRPSYIYGVVASKLDSRLDGVRKRLLAGEEFFGFHDMYKSPLGVGQLAQAVTGLAASDFVGTLHIAGERMSVYDFYQQAMTALGVDTTNLVARAMPPDPSLLRDTSLDISRWKKLSGIAPEPVSETLKKEHLSQV